MQSKEESKQDFSKIKKLESAVGTFGEETKDEDNILDEDTAKQIKDIAESEDISTLQYDLDVERNMNDVRVAVIGNVDSGKSTLVGVLTKSMLDDGRGLARSKVFNFTHEQVNGRTSSIGQEIMGFDV
jgi:GTPase